MVVQENEFITFLIGFGGLIFILGNLNALKKVPSWRLLLGGYVASLSAWILTILEGFKWPNLLNLLEHLSYTTGSLLLALWFFINLNNIDTECCG